MASSERDEVQLPATKEETETEPSPFFEWLQTDKGHEIAGRMMTIIEDLKRRGLEKSSTMAMVEAVGRYAVVIIAIVVAAYLAWHGKLDSTVSMLFGTLVGFFFGKVRI